jgi:murein hydrolase activator
LLALATSPALGAAPQDELKELRERIQALQNELSEREESKGEAADALKGSEQAISQSRRSLRELNRQQEKLNAELRQLQAREASTRVQLRHGQTQLENVLGAEYRGSKHDLMALLLSGKDPAATSRELHYYRYIARSRAELIERLRGNLAEVKKLSDDTERKREELKAITAREAEEKARLESERESKRQVLARLSSEIERSRKEISTLKRDETRLQRLVEALAKMLAKKEAQKRAAAKREAAKRALQRKLALAKRAEPNANAPAEPRSEVEPDFGNAAFAKLKGRLPLPVRGELTNRFGSPRSGSRLAWSGLFIRSPEGQEVKAVAAGRVVFSDWLRGFGNLLIVDHGSGFMSIYGNNETLYKQVGEALQGGEPIAAVGNSGGNFQSGLYFELRHQGKPVDPMGWLAK